MKKSYDILIAGGGIAGLTAAAVFGSRGRSVLCVDPAPSGAGAADTRTTAFLTPSITLLNECGVWPMVVADVAPLEVMRLIDAGGRNNRPRESADFAASELHDGPFGWNIPNGAMREALERRISQLPSVRLIQGVALDRITQRRDEVIARLSDGSALRAKLIIGADGRGSPTRKLAGITARRTDYGQKALVFTISHPEPHENASVEIHRTGGPFTLVPMPDGPEGPRSSVVWMEEAATADRLAALDIPEFEAELNERSLGVFGPARLVSRRAAWPIISLLASRLTSERVALIAEAAHVVPPIGAQGLNMSLGDIQALASAIEGGDPGAPAALRRYQARWPEIAARVAGVGLLNRAAMAEAQPLRDLRKSGFP